MNDSRNRYLLVIDPIDNPITVDETLSNILIVSSGTVLPEKGKVLSERVMLKIFLTTAAAYEGVTRNVKSYRVDVIDSFR